jgi:hypothetical protein
MKKFKFLFLSLLVFVSIVFVFSCVPEDLKKSTNLINDEISSSKSPNSSNETSEFPIPFADSMFHFPDEQSFQAVKEEIRQKREEYKEYFIWRDLNFSSFDQITKITSEVTDSMTETQVNQLLTQYNVTPNNENEVYYKFNMLYKNLLLNLNGFITIGQYFVVYRDEDMSYYNSKEHFNLCQKGKSFPVKVHKFRDEKTGSRFPQLKCSGTCRQTFDPGRNCQDRRLRGTIEMELEAFNNTGDCKVLFEAEAETAWFKKVAYIWWLHKADRLYVEMDLGIFNDRGSSYQECFKNVPLTATNRSSLGVSDVIFCSSPLSPPKLACSDAYDYDYGFIKGIGIHSGTENGNCGGTRNCNSNCN